MSLTEWGKVPDLTTIGAFYDDPGFIRAVAVVPAGEFALYNADHVVFSYHRLPEKQVEENDATGG